MNTRNLNRLTFIFAPVKFMATILMCYFCMLIVQPLYHSGNMMAKADKCSAGMCCKKNTHQTPAKPCSGTACNTDICNPFVPCGISIASRAINFEFGNPIVELSNIQKPAVNDHIISTYLSDCWRPPRLS